MANLKLDAKEIEILKLYAEEGDQKVMAKLLRVSPHYVWAHMQRLRNRFGYDNSVVMVVDLIRRGLL